MTESSLSKRGYNKPSLLLLLDRVVDCLGNNLAFLDEVRVRSVPGWPKRANPPSPRATRRDTARLVQAWDPPQ